MSADYSSDTLLQYLDAPLKILIFSVDEAVVLATPFMTGMLLDYFFTGIVLSLVLLGGLKASKKRIASDGSLQQAVYWYLPTKKTLPKSNIKEYLT